MATPRYAKLIATLGKNPRALCGLALLGFFLLLGLFGAELAPHDPSEFLAAPHQPPDTNFWLGTTGEGKDVLSQTLAGARISLLVGFGVGVLVVFLGALIGISAAYFGGWLDEALSLFTNLFLIVPGLPLAVVLAAYLPQGPLSIAFVLTLTGWAWNARVLRAQALSLRNRDFVLAATLLGETRLRVVFGEILPNMTPLLVSAFINASVYAIGAQVGLEFLGLGDAGLVTWGTNLYWASNSGALLTGAWWTILPSGLCIGLIGFALALLNSVTGELTQPALAPHAGTADSAASSKLSKLRGLVTPVVRRVD